MDLESRTVRAAASGITRRQLIAGSLGVAAAATFPELLRVADGLPPVPGGTRLDDLPFSLSADLPLGRLLGDGLDGRLYTDLSKADHGDLITPTESFFVRSATPASVNGAPPWPIHASGLVARERRFDPLELASRATDQGLHVLECAGNSRFTAFGLISCGRWRGVPLAGLLEEADPTTRATALLVEGRDHSSGDDRAPRVCSWVFPLDQLADGDAFLATHLGERPLATVNGAPVRLAVPGWYGCCWIKWVERLMLVDDSHPSTPQMREFAERTHQQGVPELAAQFQPATIDLTALPIRTERWRIDGRLHLRIVGLAWGGSGATDRLVIRFSPDGPWERVSDQPRTAGAGSSWTLWAHLWRPPRAGRHLLQLAVDDPAIRTRRLDLAYYARGIELSADDL